MMETSAKIVADSITAQGARLTTFEIVIHRFVLAEFNTHRVLSRNSASSRAIPLRRQMVRLIESPAVPLSWPLEQPGMQGGSELGEPETWDAKTAWQDARNDAILHAKRLGELGVHKSIANRLLEPFMWHTIVCTGTAWGNFFGLRCSKMAQPEIRAVAEMMFEEYSTQVPIEMAEGDWHLPYLNNQEIDSLGDSAPAISAARCARVSYLTQDGVRDPSKDLELYERLIEADPSHASPLEHVATPYKENGHMVTTKSGQILCLPRYGNFFGWHQLRYDVEAEKSYQAYS